MKEKLLFVCSRNQWRSPTADLLFRNHPFYEARSAGTSERARIRLSTKLIGWADIILVMERKHKEMVEARYRQEVREKTMIVLDIEDNYQLNDPELVGILKDKLFHILNIEL